ncbi:MAG: hypothetical protein K0S70_89 [Microbacterium sp.]|jgi:hypothetical protein|nr:hypothetical protein [Microbacterium sp.]
MSGFDQARIAGVVGVAKGMSPWFTKKADEILMRIKTDTHDDVMLYHDAVSVLVAARGVLNLVANLPLDEAMKRLSEAARPGPWRAYETVQADNFIVEESQGLLNGPGPVMGPSYDKSTVEYVVALVNAHRATLDAAEPTGEESR